MTSGNGLGPDAARVDEVDAEVADAGPELREGVQRRLGGAPVVALRPMGDQLAQVREVRPVGPAGIGDLVGKSRPGEALAQVREHGVGNGDAKWLDVHARRFYASAIAPSKPRPAHGDLLLELRAQRG